MLAPASVRAAVACADGHWRATTWWRSQPGGASAGRMTAARSNPDQQAPRTTARGLDTSLATRPKVSGSPRTVTNVARRSADVPLFAGSATRRRRTLAHLSPIFDLHLNRARNPSDIEWGCYDFIALIQLTVDTVALSSGLDGSLGVPRADVVREM